MWKQNTGLCLILNFLYRHIWIFERKGKKIPSSLANILQCSANIYGFMYFFGVFFLFSRKFGGFRTPTPGSQVTMSIDALLSFSSDLNIKLNCLIGTVFLTFLANRRHPIWIAKCLTQFDQDANFLSQVWHLNGLFFSWTLKISAFII